jgi:aryl-alcohol dehydrogenase-like predicted oxidoreductase
VLAAGHGIVIRPAFVYGRGGGEILRTLIEYAVERGESLYPGDGENCWPNVHVDDLGEAYALAVARAPAGTVLNVVGGEASLRSVSEAIGRLIGRPERTSSVPSPMRWGHFRSPNGSARRASASNPAARGGSDGIPPAPTSTGTSNSDRTASCSASSRGSLRREEHDMEMVNLVLGAMFFGTRVNESISFELLDRFVAAGGTMVDTANSYAFWVDPSGVGGQSEQVVGRWLASRPGSRDRVYLATKVGAAPAGPGQWPANAEGLSAAAVKAAAQASLRRLRTDRIDLYWTHMEDRTVPLEETAGALGELVAAGSVGRLGCSNQPLWRVERARQVARANRWAEYTALQLRHSYLQPRPGAPVTGTIRFGWVTDEALDYVQAHPALSLWAYTPLLGGAYVRPERLPEAYQHPGTTRRLAALDAVAAELGATRNQVVLAWLGGGDPPVTPIVGVSTTAQLQEALSGASLALTDTQRRRLDAAS